MTASVAQVTHVGSWVRDILALGKPRLSTLVIATTAGGMWLAPGGLSTARTLLVLAATTILVGAANALNCYLERDVDALMTRTRSRPLPAGRFSAPPVWRWAWIVAGAMTGILGLAANPLTAVLGAIACLSYVMVYTPMKRLSPLAVLVGAVPGALPPLMGWTAVTGRLDATGIALFAVLFFWQLPHFIAISMYLRDDYARAGLQVFSVALGDRAARLWTIASTVALIPVTLVLVPLGAANQLYGGLALALGLALLGFTVVGLSKHGAQAWGRRVFAGSIVYLTLLLVALVMGAR